VLFINYCSQTESEIGSSNGRHVVFIIIIIRSSSSCFSVLIRTFAASHRRFRNLIKTHGRTPLNEWSAGRKGLYLHTTTQHRNTRTNIHTSIGIRTHNPSNQAASTYALHCAATGTGFVVLHCTKYWPSKSCKYLHYLLPSIMSGL
jgi:hypothetical protein